jgi:hypothetical protein
MRTDGTLEGRSSRVGIHGIEHRTWEMEEKKAVLPYDTDKIGLGIHLFPER